MRPTVNATPPGCAQRDLGGTDDLSVWRHAHALGFVIVTKDDDFLDLAAFHGPPPVVIRLVLGNCSNAQVLLALRNNRQAS